MLPLRLLAFVLRDPLRQQRAQKHRSARIAARGLRVRPLSVVLILLRCRYCCARISKRMYVASSALRVVDNIG